MSTTFLKSHEILRRFADLEDAFALLMFRKLVPTSIGCVIHGDNETKIGIGILAGECEY
jgi:hypothetical protein